MPRGKTVFIAAGEASGDLHAGKLAENLRQLLPSVRMLGLGGEQMRAAGVQLLFGVEQLSFMGFFEIISHLPFMRRVMKTSLDKLRQEKPDLLILVDYPGFNLRLAGRAREMGLKVMYYISPQIWAWGSNRLEKIKKTIDKMVVILPFEEKLYKEAGVDVEFVGHPLLEEIDFDPDPEEFYKRLDIPQERPILGLLPGSRPQEVRRILPVMLKSAEKVLKEFSSIIAVIGLAPTLRKEEVQPYLKTFSGESRLIESGIYDLMRHSRLVLVASGTATLETAVIGTPFLIVYKTSFLTYLLARRMISIPHIGLVNVVAGKKIVSEFVQNQAKPEKIAAEVLALLKDRGNYDRLKNELGGVKGKLGEPGAALKAARIACDMIDSRGRIE
jgi:lipid-A-disaccharide synthase